MSDALEIELQNVYTGIGQGSVLEQIDKRYRKQQRLTLFKMLEKVDSKGVDRFWKHAKFLTGTMVKGTSLLFRKRKSHFIIGCLLRKGSIIS
jgi:hypothetical protein